MSSPVLDATTCESCGVCCGECPARSFPELAHEDDTVRGILAGGSEASLLPACQMACPIHQDIPGYLAALARADQAAALETILRDSPFPSVLGHVCHRPCERACFANPVQDPPRIRALKRFAAELERPSARPRTEHADIHVTVVGAGPAGLGAAWHLARAGACVTVVESESVAGGMLAWAIPEFRLPAAALKRDLDYILSWGIDLRLGTRLDPDEAFAHRQGGHCLVLACGAPVAAAADLPGSHADGVWLGLDFLRCASLGPEPDVRGPVIVVGGGNTAVDAARMALRKTDDVTLVYRRERRDMPAFIEEVEAAEREGLRIVDKAEPVALQANAHGHLAQLTYRSTIPDGVTSDGRRRFRSLRDTQRTVRAHLCVLAFGQESARAAWARAFGFDELAPDESGRLAPGVYAAGDLVTGPATVVQALAAGITCAQAIIENGGR